MQAIKFLMNIHKQLKQPGDLFNKLFIYLLAVQIRVTYEPVPLIVKWAGITIICHVQGGKQCHTYWIRQLLAKWAEN